MMISAFAKGAQILNEPRYAEAARAAADFLRRHLWDDQRQILLAPASRTGNRRSMDSSTTTPSAAWRLLDLYETTFEARDFEWAVRLAERAIELFADTENGGFFSTAGDAPDALLRLKDDYDGAEPSGNSGMAMLLLRLARMTDRADFRAAAEHTLRAFASRMEESGTGVPQMLVAHSFALGAPERNCAGRAARRSGDAGDAGVDPPPLSARRRGDARRAELRSRCRRSKEPPPPMSAKILPAIFP